MNPTVRGIALALLRPRGQPLSTVRLAVRSPLAVRLSLPSEIAELIRVFQARPAPFRPAIAFRPFHTSPNRSGILDAFRTSASPPSSPPSAQSHSDHEEADIVVTEFQSRIAALETEAIAKPDNVKAQQALLLALMEAGEYAGVCKYYEAAALGDQGRSGPLLEDERSFGMFAEALGRTGQMGEVARVVRRRDALLSGNVLAAAASAPASVSPTPTESTSAEPASSSTPSIIAPSTTAPTPSPAWSVSSLLSSNKGSPAPSSVSSLSTTQGTATAPVYVQFAKFPLSYHLWGGIGWLVKTLLIGFFILGLLGVLLETVLKSSPLMKMGQQPQEFKPEDGKVVTFKDAHGVEEAKNELEEIVEFLRNPEKFASLGGKLPKGVLLTGPPGTGKTLLARAVAGEAGVPFLFASGSSFDEMFVGVGAKRLRELFEAARAKAPAIIFIDELDAVGGKRNARDAHWAKQTLNQLLVELDGFEQSEGVVIIGATNFPESLDKALTRPGRFDRHIIVSLPDVRGRMAILKHHMTNVHFDVDVDASIIARGTPGMSGADLQNLVNQAAVKASREGAPSVRLQHFEWAKDRILMGAERRSQYVSPESKKTTAYHEGGHALVALYTKGAAPLHKVTIMPRGPALGITFQLPEQDKDSYSRREYSAMIDVALGGRAAEELIFGSEDVTSGCASDLRRATDVASNMIRNYGFSDKVGLVAHGNDEENPYLSGKKKDEIEGEIRSFLDTAMERAAGLLKHHQEELHKLASALVEYETLTLEEVRKVVRGEKLNRDSSDGQTLIGVIEKTGQLGPIVEGIL